MAGRSSIRASNRDVARIQAALAALGAGPAELRRIYLTHHHPDHIAGLPALRAWAPRAEVVATEHEAQIISGRRERERPRNPIIRFLAERQPVPTAPVDRIAREGETIAGFRIIATPGHSLGHTSLLHEGHGFLFTADAFGRLYKLQVGTARAFCIDPAEAKRSARKLLGYDYDAVLMAHGGILREGAKGQLRRVTTACHWDEES
jgi:glyoxylase-like metal-dependent hydrolase (beta-lactamase superfamily II)